VAGGFGRLGEDEIHAWRSFRLVRGRFEDPAGRPFDRTYVEHPGAVAVVALDGDDVLLVRQFRAPLGAELLEIPAGTLDKGDAESPLECGVRELAEEVGARADRWDHLATYAVAPGISSEVLHLYLARDLTLGDRRADGIEEESMTVERLVLSEAPAAIATGRITDAKTIIGLLLVAARTGPAG
jgi:8-oxo-dGTP pyrophosphatase MutT (NUDIX family)